MSRIDVLKSLMRSAALTAVDKVRNAPATQTARDLLDQAGLLRTRITEAALTAAVARAANATAATVRAQQGRLLIDASFDDSDTPLQFAIWPASFSFAPLGAKEIAFGVEPIDALRDPRAQDVCGALATEIAHAIWRAVIGPVLPGESTAFVSREGDRLVADLRSVPAVRRNQAKKLAMTFIEALRPQRIEIEGGELRVLMKLAS
jgi:hypothetical protein